MPIDRDGCQAQGKALGVGVTLRAMALKAFLQHLPTPARIRETAPLLSLLQVEVLAEGL